MGWWGRDWVDGGGGIGWDGEGLDKDYLLCAVHYW